MGSNILRIQMMTLRTNTSTLPTGVSPLRAPLSCAPRLDPAPRAGMRAGSRAQRRSPRRLPTAGIVVFLLASLCVCVGACDPRPATAASAQDQIIKDELGRAVKIPGNIRRIVSLAPNLTETLFALGVGDQLVGDTDFCDYPEEAAKKSRVGGPINPSFEHIAALSPQLILASKSINRRETVAALDRLGFNVYVTDPQSVQAMIESVARLGRVLHADTQTDSLVNSLRDRLAELDRRLSGVTPRKVLFVVWSSPLISIGRGTFLADALRYAKAQSVVNTAAEWPRVSLEEIVRLQPEFLIFASAHAGDVRQQIEELRTRPGWRDLQAVRAGKIVVISDAINRPAPRLIGAIEELASALHPEHFAEKFSKQSPAWEACACAL
jgi:iron complex transport system substrate-binding protein